MRPVLAGLIGAAIAVVCLVPLPATGDLYAARRWGVGASYVGLLLGFPLSAVAVPLSVALHPVPADDASGAATEAAIIVAIVALNWAACALLLPRVGRLLSRRSRNAASRSRPPA
jgi:hypothetical protein